jgi:hypothetical protein
MSRIRPTPGIRKDDREKQVRSLLRTSLNFSRLSLIFVGQLLELPLYMFVSFLEMIGVVYCPRDWLFF